MKRAATATGIILAYILFIGLGGLGVVVAQFVPSGAIQHVLIAVLGMAFAATFLWLLVSGLRGVFAGERSTRWNAIFSMVNVALLLLAFASIYRSIGFTDTTASKPFETHDFWTACYFSVVTFSTLGYGDMRPIGIGRFIACVESFTGYLVLGIIASSGAEIIKQQGQNGGEKD